MNKFFNYDLARTTIGELYELHHPDVATSIFRISEVKNIGFTFEKMQYPPSVHLMVNNKGKDWEVIMKMYGIMCGGMLPPYDRKLVRNLHQQIKITALGTPAFNSDMRTLQQLRKNFQQHVGGHDVGQLEFLPYKGYPCMEAHACYFTNRNLVPYDKNILFPHLVDPHRVLSDLQPACFI
ncbi:hypothetical protein EST38_g13218 [Candolleomyces aberdarensis]|uniref:Uncharacterized protein n=1 Tax=Candolleomyces aberdarensis TaxID=2316362 RepID=A0A4Q2D2S5_9AGAR|nr:hypothetical protein EST38_g13218 [Candolleomyces aberdarensis]